MKYYILLQSQFRYEVLDTRDTLEEATKRAEKLNKRLERKDIKIVGLPEIRSGLKLFRQGKYYRTIIKENKTIWILNNTENLMAQDDVARKSSKKNNDTIMEWILSGKLDHSIEEYDENYVNNVYDGKDEGLEEMMDAMVIETGTIE